MAVRPPATFETPGAPQILSRLPEVGALHDAGAKKLAATVRKAVQLRDECAAARGALNEARQAVKLAQQRDRLDHAEAMRKDVQAALEPRHAAKATAEAEAAERRFQALALATEQAANELYGMAPDEAPRVIEAARRTRERAVKEIAEATERIVRALDDAEAGLSLARWASEPANRRWRVPLKTVELGQPRVRLDRVLAALEALPAVLESTPLPGEEREEPTIRFGWSGVGQIAPAPPGSQVS